LQEDFIERGDNLVGVALNPGHALG
jgi:hypothetical protein